MPQVMDAPTYLDTRLPDKQMPKARLQAQYLTSNLHA